MTPPARIAAAAVVTLLACRPIVYAVDDGPDDATTSDHDPDPHTSDPDPTDPTDGPTEAPACFNAGLDPGETDIDCGGPCPPCQPGQACGSPGDCVTGVCELGKCAEFVCHTDDECKLQTPDVPCMRGVCDPGGACTLVPAFDGEPCDDFDACTFESACAMGQCLGLPRSCDEFTGPCRKGFCNPQTGNCAAEFASDGEACEDGDMCTHGETCAQGECVAPPPQPLFFETFEMEQGWELGPLWQIGPPAPSQCMPGFDDPESTATGDGSLAGTEIGGCLPPEMLPQACLTSPKLPSAPDGSPLVLTFSSWYAADKPIFATVEMSDGFSWLPLLVLDAGQPDPAWVQHLVDLPLPIDAPALQVRFCLAQSEPTMGIHGGWSVDDVAIGPPACAP